MAQIQLDTPVQYVQGVGPVRAEQLAKLGVKTVEDLLLYFPFRFDLRKQAQPIRSVLGHEDSITVAGEVLDAEEHRFGRRPFFQCRLRDETATITAKWFHGGYLRDVIKPGMYLAVHGAVTVWRETLQMINPRHQIIWDPKNTNLQRDELLPVYPAGGKLTSGIISQVVHRVLPQAKDLLRRWFPPAYLEERGLMSRPAAVAGMHRPEDKAQWELARTRLAYDECLLMQLAVGILRMRQISRPAHALRNTQEIDRRIRARFPFPLTAAQDRAVAEIAADVARPRPMNRLLQDDVGSGKTVVALYACLLTVANRSQAAIMAPTEILAAQHYRKLRADLEGSRVRMALLVGGQRGSVRKKILEKLAAGELDVVVGTHALLSEGVRFARLALVVVDEQHKFGVRQRSGIRGKGFAPHYLVMTATPIPRTLALTVFGDLDCSTIDELPPGRGTTTTRCLRLDQADEVAGLVADKLRKGQQAYFIYPLVTPSPALELQAAEEAYEQLRAGPLSEFGVGLIHGQMTGERKQAVMRDFQAGVVRVLVASVVVEVGVDVAAANVMVVMHAERFGLAQLHQLRGRIGRSAHDALCLLVASPSNPIARKRLDVLVETSDGFKVAEEDLRLRGPGEFFGTAQHGMPDLRVADLIEDFDLLRLARRDACTILGEDPDLALPQHQQIRHELMRLYAGRLELLRGA